MKILVATTNRGKVKEIARLFQGLDIELVTLLSIATCPVHTEEGRTFEENALSKAEHYWKHTGMASLAEDSGLEVDALGGRPGVFSARYAGESAADSENIEKLLTELRGVPPKQRSARFRCAAAVASDTGAYQTSGCCEGIIAAQPVGQHGFGYDSIFVPRGFGWTFGELGTEFKLTLSHRTQAFEKIRSYLAQKLADES